METQLIGGQASSHFSYHDDELQDLLTTKTQWPEDDVVRLHSNDPYPWVLANTLFLETGEKIERENLGKVCIGA